MGNQKKPSFKEALEVMSCVANIIYIIHAFWTGR